MPQDRDQPGFPALQLGQQHVAEQVVVAIPLPLPVQRHQQQVRLGQIGQGGTRSGQVEHGLAERAGQPLQYRGPGQELPLPPGDPLQELRLHVLGHQPVPPAKRHHRTRQRAALAQVQGRQVQPGRPPFGPPVQLGHVVLAEHHLSGAQQLFCLTAGQRQVTGTDLQNPALGPQSRDPQGRLVPPGERQPRPSGHVIGQHRQRGPALPVAQQVHIIDDQDERRGHARERRSQAWHHRAGHRARRRGQRVEHPIADRLHRIEGLGHVAEQDLRVVVRLVDRHPREGLAVVLRPLRQQGGLPVTRRGDHRHDRAGNPAR